MKNIARKLIIYSMIGVMQLGFGAAVIEASPAYNKSAQRMVQLDDRDQHHDRQQEHDRRYQEENRRHEQEMRRHHNENMRDWYARQARENDRHNNELNEIEAFLFGVVIGVIVS